MGTHPIFESDFDCLTDEIGNGKKENYIPNSSLYQEFIIEYQLLAEYRLLQKNGPHNGVYIIPSSKSALIWFGVIFVRSGPYMNGIFKFRIHIPHDYPANESAPLLMFDPPIFHPKVELESGIADLGFSTWRSPKDRIWHIIPHMRRMFLKIETENCQNQEAASRYQNDKSEFKTKVKECVEFSNQIVYEAPKTDDQNEIRFVKLEDEEYNLLRNKMLRNIAPKLSSGHSWMSRDCPRPFSEI